jgi:hypothetical protein
MVARLQPALLLLALPRMAIAGFLLLTLVLSSQLSLSSPCCFLVAAAEVEGGIHLIPFEERRSLFSLVVSQIQGGDNSEYHETESATTISSAAAGRGGGEKDDDDASPATKGIDDRKEEDLSPYGTGGIKAPAPPEPVLASPSKAKGSSPEGSGSGSGTSGNATTTTETAALKTGNATSMSMASSKHSGSGPASSDDEASGAQDDDPTDAGIAHFTQWDVTNVTDFDGMLLNQSSAQHHVLLPPWLLPPENASDEPPHWDVAMLSLFVGLSVLLCAATWWRRWKADQRRREAGYEPVHPTLVV